MQQQLSICQENNSFPPDRFYLVQEDPKPLKSLLLAQFKDELIPRAVFVLQPGAEAAGQKTLQRLFSGSAGREGEQQRLRS